MAEGEPDKTLTLAQQWFVQEKEEQAGQGETPIKAAEDENPTSATSVEVVTSEEVVEAATEEAPATEESSEAPEQAESEEQEVVEQKPEVKIETAPVDFRFPTTNQTRHCFTRYIEYHRCIAAKGEGAPECEKFAKYYRSLCPAEWIERWNEQRENGTFPGPL